jgi:hypothetical protein
MSAARRARINKLGRITAIDLNFMPLGRTQTQTTPQQATTHTQTLLLTHVIELKKSNLVRPNLNYSCQK